MTTVGLIGTLDTKGDEYAYFRDRLRACGVDALLIDIGVLGTPRVTPDITRSAVAEAAGADADALATAADRGAAIDAMAAGAASVMARLHAEGRIDGVAGLGGSGGSAAISRAMRALPVGVPKLLVSTMASGDTRPYVGESDLTLMYSVADIAGLNGLTRQIISNAAGAIAGMASAERPDTSADRPLVAASMFGVTTQCVDRARVRLEELGYEVLVFHATGSGGEALEGLVDDGIVSGVLDVTTTELADELVGGVLAAGPTRLTAAGRRGIPQVVSVGALDMVNFGPVATVPDAYRDRLLYEHNPTVTLMRTTADECRQLGTIIADKLNGAQGPTAVFLPLRGVSAIDVVGAPFHDPEADRALFDALTEGLSPDVEVHRLDTDINDVVFADAIADRFDEMHRACAQERDQEVAREA